MTEENHSDLIRRLAAAFRPYGWSDESVTAYLIAVVDLPLDSARQAVVNQIRTKDQMPSASELRREILAIAIPDGPPHVDAAWNEVERQLSTVGRLGKPAWSHPLIGKAARNSSTWWNMCVATDLTGHRIAFQRTYRALVEDAQREILISNGLTGPPEIEAAR